MSYYSDDRIYAWSLKYYEAYSYIGFVFMWEASLVNYALHNLCGWFDFVKEQCNINFQEHVWNLLDVKHYKYLLRILYVIVLI